MSNLLVNKFLLDEIVFFTQKDVFSHSTVFAVHGKVNVFAGGCPTTPNREKITRAISSLTLSLDKAALH